MVPRCTPVALTRGLGDVVDVGVGARQVDELGRRLRPDGTVADGDERLALHRHLVVAGDAVGHAVHRQQVGRVDHLHAVRHVEVHVPAHTGGRAVARNHLDDDAELVTFNQRGTRARVQLRLRIRVEEHVDQVGLQVVRVDEKRRPERRQRQRDHCGRAPEETAHLRQPTVPMHIQYPCACTRQAKAARIIPGLAALVAATSDCGQIVRPSAVCFRQQTRNYGVRTRAMAVSDVVRTERSEETDEKPAFVAVERSQRVKLLQRPGIPR